MVDRGDRIELSIDTAGAFAGLAISRQGNLLAELNWRTNNNHSAELIPAIDALLERTHTSREAIGVLFVNKGPGSYAGLRVGISTAMGLALALSAELVAVGRLELDAFPRAAYPGPICAVHQAGRGDVAWAVYVEDADGWRQVQPPRLGTVADLVASIPAGTLCSGELSGIEQRLLTATSGIRLVSPAASLRRAATLAALGWLRYAAGVRDNPVAVEPLYLREPAITPPKAKTIPA